MSGVVLRCPSCGTTRATPGECDACHEAAVQWFCRNHEPGRWIDGPPCPECGAGVERAAPVPPPPPRRHSTSPPSLDPPPRRAPVEDPWAGGPWGAPREPADVVGRAGGVDVPAGWRVEPPPTLHVRPVPILGCVGRLLMYAVTAVILLAMATCWFFGGGIVVGAAPDEPPRTVAERPATPAPAGAAVDDRGPPG